MKPRLLDLFCGAGGCTSGYQLAGFHVTGVDLVASPRYIGDDFHQGDALEFLAACGHEYDAIHASPPCHDHANVTGRNRKANGYKGTGWLLEATIDALQGLSVPWVVENVETAEFPTDVFRFRLCGSSFGLDVRRHRWFASNIAVLVPGCAHHLQSPRFRSLDSRRPVGALASVVGVHGHLNYPGEFALRCDAMGIDWMTNDELSQAIPPAYTFHVGTQFRSRPWSPPMSEPGESMSTRDATYTACVEAMARAMYEKFVPPDPWWEGEDITVHLYWRDRAEVALDALLALRSDTDTPLVVLRDDLEQIDDWMVAPPEDEDHLAPDVVHRHRETCDEYPRCVPVYRVRPHGESDTTEEKA